MVCGITRGQRSYQVSCSYIFKRYILMQLLWHHMPQNQQLCYSQLCSWYNSDGISTPGISTCYFSIVNISLNFIFFCFLQYVWYTLVNTGLASGGSDKIWLCHRCKFLRWYSAKCKQTKTKTKSWKPNLIFQFTFSALSDAISVFLFLSSSSC